MQPQAWPCMAGENVARAGRKIGRRASQVTPDRPASRLTPICRAPSLASLRPPSDGSSPPVSTIVHRGQTVQRRTRHRSLPAPPSLPRTAGCRHDHARTLVRRADHVEQQRCPPCSPAHTPSRPAPAGRPSPLLPHAVSCRSSAPHSSVAALTRNNCTRLQGRTLRLSPSPVGLPDPLRRQEHVLTTFDISHLISSRISGLLPTARAKSHPPAPWPSREPRPFSASGPPARGRALRSPGGQEPEVVDVLAGAPRRHLLSLGGHRRPLQRLRCASQQPCSWSLAFMPTPRRRLA